MEDRETPRIHKYEARKTTRIMMATVRHVTSSSGLRKFQTDGFLLGGVYHPLALLSARSALNQGNLLVSRVEIKFTRQFCVSDVSVCGLTVPEFLHS